MAGPHVIDIGKTRVNHFLDGLGKAYRFQLDGAANTARWSSRVLRSNLYNQSDHLGQEAPSVQFEETTPSRGYSGARNVLLGASDNGYVVQLQAPDGDGMIGLTDAPGQLASFLTWA